MSGPVSIQDSAKTPRTLFTVVCFLSSWPLGFIPLSVSFSTGLERHRYYFDVLHFPSDERGHETTMKTTCCPLEDFRDAQSMRHAGDATVACKGNILRPKRGCV
ncbi:hypothetical protein COCC4DRAFT_59777 [Bipolaris maydis ATCC 48331]|uniref:Uncharacterized protein n=2 Tax=Cochliobolus heterostrophus TaxID=5016 RepID=M2UES3_COCH5|nr:uncharacterized protein COCC4DRAFT_59777 [Bipolaris maydis ATCC 48331]EMD86352.1 hypothetical protein COCHEDRAFT_1160653 [Bipolaris maydis C5]ENI06302.1 hypothetical protein COCC4DRAFT_59777 [Bipolaris maydis ATCC 48331]KAJ6213974.1 hypothetical protein PSV09DRAFT_1160653 [Bipolaris maydis]